MKACCARQDVSTRRLKTLLKITSLSKMAVANSETRILGSAHPGLPGPEPEGHYVMLNLETDPDTLAEYERIMGLNEDVLRFKHCH